MTLKKAEEALADRMSEVRAGYEKPKAVKFAEFAPKCVAEHGKRMMLKESTKANYTSNLNRHLLPYFGGFRLGELEANPELIDRFIEAKVDEGLSAKTINNLLRLLNVILKRALRSRLIRTNPVESVDRPREDTPDMEILREAEIKQLEQVYKALLRRADAGQKPWWHLAHDVTFFCLQTALRKSELRALLWRDVNLAGKQIEVREGLVGRWKSTPKGRKSRTIELGPRAVALLKQRRARSRFTSPSDYVFCHPDLGTPFEDSKLARDYLRPALVKTGIIGEGGSRRGFRPFQDARHTSLTYEAAAGNSIVYIQHRAGHAQITTTMRYIHAAQVLFPGAARKAEVRMFGPAKRPR
jgi:integrase